MAYKVYKNTLIPPRSGRNGFLRLWIPIWKAPPLWLSPKKTLPHRPVSWLSSPRPAPNLELKASVVEGTYYDQAGTQVIATIPSERYFWAELLGSMQSPIANLARVLNQIAEKNGGNAAEA